MRVTITETCPDRVRVYNNVAKVSLSFAECSNEIDVCMELEDGTDKYDSIWHLEDVVMEEGE